MLSFTLIVFASKTKMKAIKLMLSAVCLRRREGPSLLYFAKQKKFFMAFALRIGIVKRLDSGILQ